MIRSRYLLPDALLLIVGRRICTYSIDIPVLLVIPIVYSSWHYIRYSDDGLTTDPWLILTIDWPVDDIASDSLPYWYYYIPEDSLFHYIAVLFDYILDIVIDCSVLKFLMLYLFIDLTLSHYSEDDSGVVGWLCPLYWRWPGWLPCCCYMTDIDDYIMVFCCWYPPLFFCILDDSPCICEGNGKGWWPDVPLTCCGIYYTIDINCWWLMDDDDDIDPVLTFIRRMTGIVVVRDDDGTTVVNDDDRTAFCQYSVFLQMTVPLPTGTVTLWWYVDWFVKLPVDCPCWHCPTPICCRWSHLLRYWPANTDGDGLHWGWYIPYLRYPCLVIYSHLNCYYLMVIWHLMPVRTDQ